MCTLCTYRQFRLHTVTLIYAIPSLFEMAFIFSPMESSSSHDGMITLPNTPGSGEIDLEVAIEPAQAVRTNQGPASTLDDDDLEPDGEIFQSPFASTLSY